MINFNKEFGYPDWGNISKNKWHRFRYSSRMGSCCNLKLILWYVNEPIQLSDICKKCLSTFSAEEIEDLKHWLILKKLGVSV